MSWVVLIAPAPPATDPPSTTGIQAYAHHSKYRGNMVRKCGKL